MTPEALAIVTNGNPEDWGESYIVMERCLRYYKPERGNLLALFRSAMWRNTIDKNHIKNSERDRMRIMANRARNSLIRAVRRPRTPDLNLPDNVPEQYHLRTRGVPARMIGSVLGKSERQLDKERKRFRSTLSQCS